MSSTTNGLASERPHIFVFDYMRTRSHLFWRWLSLHPELYATYHRYMISGWVGGSQMLDKLRVGEARQAEIDSLLKSNTEQETNEDNNAKLIEDVAEAEAKVRWIFRSGGKY